MSSVYGIKPKTIKPTQLEAALGNGILYAHMFEMPLSEAIDAPKKPEESAESFFAVMAGEKDSLYSNPYHPEGVKGCSDGHPALATTLLVKDKPVSLFVEQSQVGILLDGKDEAHAKPLFVNHADAGSCINNDVITFGLPKIGGCLGSKLRERQQGVDLINLDGSQRAQLSLKNVLPERRAKAKEAVVMLSDALKNNDLVNIYPHILIGEDGFEGMNEVLLSANLVAIKGIIVSEIARSDSIDPSGDYIKAVYEADKLQQWLYKHYKGQFPPGSLPILSYNPHRRGNQLQELDGDRILYPKLPIAESFRA